MSRLPSLPPEPETSQPPPSTPKDHSPILLPSSGSEVPGSDPYASLVARVLVTPEVAGQQIGPYRLVRVLGSGGFGTVWLAERTEPYFQRVALKFIRAGVESRHVLARFEQERQTLAALRHPNIAHVVDAGTIPGTTQPYLAIEYVDGQRIDRYCDALELTISERLELFRKVCAAVHHAHQNLVVHRDIKPANILVGADGEPKLLDFGIAKLLNPELAGSSPETREQTGPMTPEYASPEQIQGIQLSTASDIYALGVLLYELLTGRPPYRLVQRSRDAILKVILEVEPDRPSNAVTQDSIEAALDGATRTRTADELAKPRSTHPGKLKRLLAGDIDNIVLKAMRKNPRRRYETAAQLSEDIDRHLRGQPVIARPETWVYVTGKFARRNRVPVAAAACASMALIAGMAIATIQRRHAEAARAEADRLRAAAVAQRDGILESARTFLTDFTNRVRKAEGSAEAREMLARTAMGMLEKIEQADRRADQPDHSSEWQGLVADAMGEAADAIGGAGPNRGDAKRASELAAGSLAIRRKLFELSPTSDTRRSLASALVRSAHLARRLGDDVVAAQSIEEAIALARALTMDSEMASAGRRVLASALTSRGEAARRAGQLDAARRDLEESLELRHQSASEQPPRPDLLRDYSVGLIDLHELELAAGHVNTAEELLRSAIAERERIADIERLTGADQLASARTRRDLVTAQGLLLAILTRRWNNLASVSGDAASKLSGEIDQLHQRRILAAGELVGDDPRAPSDYARARKDYGFWLVGRGRAADSEPHFREALQIAGGRWRLSPSNVDLLVDVADCAFGTALALSRQPDKAATNEATRAWQDADKQFRMLCQKRPDRDDYRKRLEEIEAELARRTTPER